jgi:CubicO group peptidase (beta-lactamase class C family)
MYVDQGRIAKLIFLWPPGKPIRGDWHQTDKLIAKTCGVINMSGRLRKIGAVTGLFVLSVAYQFTSSANSASIESATDLDGYGFSRDGISVIQEMMDTAVADRRITAGIAMLSRNGQIAWLGTAGEMTPGIPMRKDAILPLASVGKMFTATAAMILYERGVIALDDPVSKYIPEFANVMVEVMNETGDSTLTPPDHPITIYHLLTHTGGLTVTGNEFWAAWDAHVGKTTTTHFARALAAMPLFAQPGERFKYGQTGASYEVLGAVIEIASGQTLEAFMTENIFEPLGLEDSYFYLPKAKSGRLPEVYRNVDGVLQLDRPYGEDFSRSTFFHGGGGVRSAPADILRFARLFLEGGSVDGVQILKADTIDLMMNDHLGDKAPERWQEAGLSWGFGAAVRYSPEESKAGAPEAYGWVGGGFAKLWVDPKKRLIAYIGFPLTPPGDNELLAEFEERVYESL